MARRSTRMPSPHLDHGAPLADGTERSRRLADWSGGVARTTAVLAVSARWRGAPPTVGATADGAPLTYDFRGSPQRYYGVRVSRPGRVDTRPGRTRTRHWSGWSPRGTRPVCRCRLEHSPA